MGVIAARRVRRGEATDRRSPYVAVVLGLVGLGLAAAGLFVAVVATQEISPPPVPVEQDR